MTSQTLEQFASGLGYNLPEYTIDRIARFNPVDKPRRNKSCWLKVFLNGNAVLGNWITGEQHIYCPSGNRISKDEWQKVQQERKHEKIRFDEQQQKQYKAKALQVREVIFLAKPAPDNHPYLVRKSIQSHGSLFGNVLSYKKVLIIPVIGTDRPFTGQVQSLQFIMESGSKRFLGGAKLKGGYYAIQIVDDAPMVICEGFSTGATLAEHYTPYSTVICAFNASNLLPVASYFKRAFPMQQITIAGDNDHNNKVNIGRVKATQAAKAVNGMVSIPEFNQGEKGSDWNDRYQLDKGVRHE